MQYEIAYPFQNFEWFDGLTTKPAFKLRITGPSQRESIIYAKNKLICYLYHHHPQFEEYFLKEDTIWAYL